MSSQNILGWLRSLRDYLHTILLTEVGIRISKKTHKKVRWQYKYGAVV
ncbi:MAG: hypothetical protein TU36_002530 [Vulcanisaeta sp. AZ3]